MNYDNVLYDFIHRTKANPQIIEERAAKESHSDIDDVKAFEVTQLVNSLLGLIVFPQQHYRTKIPSTPLGELKVLGWPTPLLQGKFPEDLTNLADLMRYVRNSIAHFNIEFTSDNGKTISGVRIWNTRNSVENWSAFLRLEELRLLVDKFVDLSLSINAADQKQEVR